MAGRGNYISRENAGQVCSKLSISTLGLVSPPSIFKSTYNEIADTATDLTAAQCAPGSVVRAIGGGADQLDLPSSVAMSAVFSNLQVGDAWIWYAANNSGGAWTITSGTKHVFITGVAAIADGSCATMLTRIESVGNYNTYRIG